MNALLQSASGSQDDRFSIKNAPDFVQINNDPILKKYLVSNMVFEYPNSSNVQYNRMISQSYSELESRLSNRLLHICLISHPKLEITHNKEVFKKLKNKIQKVYNEHQKPGWDGYEAKPLKWLPKALEFADILFQKSQNLVESVDIVPENDGCLCFEWFKSDTCFISISIKDDVMIYNYKIETVKGCGEVNFSGSQILIDQIKQVAGSNL